MVPLLAPLSVTTSLVAVLVPRRMSVPVAPTRLSIPLNESLPCPVLPPAWLPYEVIVTSTLLPPA